MKPTDAIRTRQTRELLRAARHSWRIGRDINRYVVVNFRPGPLGDELLPQRQFRAIRTKCRSWLAHHRRINPKVGPLTDIRIWEHKNGVLHVNWLLHLPKYLQREFEKKLPAWISKVVRETEVGFIKDKDIYNLNGLLKYVLKGTERNNAHRFKINPVDQGKVWGRRALASTGLGKAARQHDWETNKIAQKEQKYKKVQQQPFSNTDTSPPIFATNSGFPVNRKTVAELVEHAPVEMPDPSTHHGNFAPPQAGL